MSKPVNKVFVNIIVIVWDFEWCYSQQSHAVWHNLCYHYSKNIWDLLSFIVAFTTYFFVYYSVAIKKWAQTTEFLPFAMITTVISIRFYHTDSIFDSLHIFSHIELSVAKVNHDIHTHKNVPCWNALQTVE